MLSTDCKMFFTLSKFFQLKPLNEKFNLLGWLKYKKTFKDVQFIHLDDGTTLRRLQVIVPKSISLKGLTYHTCISVEGTLVKSKGWKQDVEFLAEKIEVVSPGAPIEYPFIERATYLKEDLRASPQYRSRTKEFASLFRVRSQAKMAFRKYLENNDFIQIDTPVITRNNCEGGGEVFTVKGDAETLSHDDKVKLREGAFGYPVHLTVSGQLHLESMASGLSRVYCFNPAFRPEGDSRLHLNEFWMVETEEAFLEGRDGYDRLLKRIEEMVKFVCKELLSSSKQDIEYHWDINRKKDILMELLPNLVSKPFIRLKYIDAIKILDENRNVLKTPQLDHLRSLNRESELFLTKFFDNSPVFVTDWPPSLKPFYTYIEENEAGDTALGVDLLMPYVGELVGGGLREYNCQKLERKLSEIDSDNLLLWYLKIREWGYAPTGGCGLGFERFLQFLLGIDNIKDTVPFPRSNNACPC